ncbi:MAG: hypothetical protein ABIP92_07890 [Arthrobacter sp.]|uniref:hypothetical protein n=1 Tax=unclassified Arthrobacter TaxID=235627 RepID=UPI00249E9C69|nr:hypothetical protein [Arthrobacter sp. EM1]WGZ80780.1 hypothetical protein QI450_06215 [Arthrobacter sp. EM1]
MSTNLQIRRIARRETRRSRALASIITAAALILGLLWLSAEAVLSLTGNAALLAAPGQIGQWMATLAANTLPAGLVAAGAGLILTGLLYLVLALGPGRRSRHIMASNRAAVVVDDDVIAASVSRSARTAADLAPEQVTTTVGGRTVEVVIHPSSGIKADAAAADLAVREEIARYGLPAAPRITVRTSTEGALGI